MSRELISADQEGTVAASLTQAGDAANEAAARSAFADYRSRKADNTLRRQDTDLNLFAQYLAQATGGQAPTPAMLALNPDAWRGVTWGLAGGFVRWLLWQGYAVNTINVRLSTIKTYAKLATQAGALSTQELAMIRTVSGYSRTEGKRVDERREAMEVPTRFRGYQANGTPLAQKKAEPVSIGTAQADALRAQPLTPQGRRDALIMHLLLDLGLRAGEVAGLDVSDVNLQTAELHFYRPKVDKVQTHRLPAGALETVRTYMAQHALPQGPLLRASRKGGELTKAGMTTRAITARVRTLGEQLGIHGLSAHDCRHYWATQAARNGTPIDRLQDAGGWASPVMPLRYVEAARIANEGVKLEPQQMGAKELDKSLDLDIIIPDN